jgi:hypothetical protein
MQCRIEAVPKIFSSSAAGLIQLNYNVSRTNIEDFNSRFVPLWEQYRIIKAEFLVRTFGSTAPGLLCCFIDDSNIGTLPTLTESRTKSTPSMSFNASSVEKLHKYVWTNHDTKEQQWIDLLTSGNPLADFKIYSDSPNYGTIPSAQYGAVYVTFTLQFRGFR